MMRTSLARRVFLAGLAGLAGIPGAAGFPELPRRADRARRGTAERQSSLLLTFLANEGFVLRHGGRAVVIDGIFRTGVPGYATLTAPLRSALEAAAAPFDHVDVVLVTHRHADHFDAPAVAGFLRRNPRATLVAPTEVVGAVRTSMGPDAGLLDGRMLPIDASAPPLRTAVRVADMAIDALKIPHGTVEHLGFLVHLGGFAVVHVGDSDGSLADYAALELARVPLDVALVPDWMLIPPGGQRIVRAHLRARRLIGMHVAEEDGPDAGLREYIRGLGGHAGVSRQIGAAFPDATVALVPGETFVVESRP